MRMRTPGTLLRPHLRLAVGLAAAPLLLAGLAACGGGETGSASCAALVVHDGHTYYARDRLARDPRRTGRSLRAVVPGCDDTGDPAQAEPDRLVRVHELAGVAPGIAVYFDGAVYVRDGRRLPGRSRRWFRETRCHTAATFEATSEPRSPCGPPRRPDAP